MIKLALFLSVFMVSIVKAEGVIAEGKTPQGTISLTDKPCIYIPNTKVAYAYDSSGRTLLGCWAADASRVFVSWNDLKTTSYSFNFFNSKEIK